MTKITITIEGNMEEVARVMGKLSELKDNNIQVPITENSSNAEWTQTRIKEVWDDISEKCKKVLTEIAKNGNSTWQQQQQNLGMSPNEIGGSLSSLGAQLRNHGLNGITYPLIDNAVFGFDLIPIWKTTILLIIQENLL